MSPTLTFSRQTWTASDGEIFPYAYWDAGLSTGERPQAVVVAVHGLSGAALDFEPLAGHLAKDQIVTYAIELRGQGNDPRPERRGDLKRIEEWFADLSSFLTLVRSRHPDSQIYYYGESMGAALLTRFVAQARESELPSGLILASPVVAVPRSPSLWHRILFHFFLRVRPAQRINFRKAARRDQNDPSKWVTRDEAHRQWFQTTTHKLDSFSVRFFKCLFELIGGCNEDAPKIKVPVLALYAANDVFIPPVQVEHFFSRLGSREKELRFFPESYHLLLHDFDKPQVLDRIESWLLRRIEITNKRETAHAQFNI